MSPAEIIAVSGGFTHFEVGQIHNSKGVTDLLRKKDVNAKYTFRGSGLPNPRKYIFYKIS